MTTQVSQPRLTFVAIYRKFGFEVRERIDGYYSPHEDRFMMVFTPQSWPSR